MFSAWQEERKKTSIIHPYLHEKIPCGLTPSCSGILLLARFIRGDLDGYPAFSLEVSAMLTVITYDVNTEDAVGQKRLRKVAKHCINMDSECKTLFSSVLLMRLDRQR